MNSETLSPDQGYLERNDLLARRERIGRTPRWNTKVSVEPGLMDEIRVRITSRDWMVLTLLHQHRYLTTAEVADLLYLSPAGERMAQRRLRWLASCELIHWPQAHGAERHWHRISRPLWLTPRGAKLLADHHGLDPTMAIRRAANAHQAEMGIDHTLAVVRFFVLLATEAGSSPSHGLFHWVGDDAMRARSRAADRPVTPDGWGRLLTPTHEAVFDLEWDRSKEDASDLRSKGRRYLESSRGRRTVAFVAPTPNRMDKIADCLRPAACGRVRFVATTVDALAERGPMAPIWRDVRDGEALSLDEVGGPARDPRRNIEDCLAKPGWWTRRTFGGEGD